MEPRLLARRPAGPGRHRHGPESGDDSDDDTDAGPDGMFGTGDEGIGPRARPPDGLRRDPARTGRHHHQPTAPHPMVAATAATIAIGLAFTVFADPLTAYTDRTAAELIQRAPYIQEVLGR